VLVVSRLAPAPLHFCRAIKLIAMPIFGAWVIVLKSAQRFRKQAHLLIYPMFHSNLLNLFSLQGLSVSMSAIGRLANMQTEQQIDSSAMPKIASQADSGESKDKRGGKRPGAGRKPNLAKILLKGVSRTTILAAVENVDVGAIIIGLLKSKREQTRLEALHFVFDRVIGKPKQDLNFSGGIVHTHTRDPILAALPKEALEALAQSYNEIIGKYATPVIDVAQDGPHNQIESKPAIEVEKMESLRATNA